MMRQLIHILLMAPWPIALSAQGSKLATLGLGTTFKRESAAHVFSVAVNQPDPVSPVTPVSIARIVVADQSFYVLPTLQASIGNGVASAGNNVALEIPLVAQHSRVTTGGLTRILRVRVSPINIVADQSFHSALLLVGSGIEYHLRQWVRLREDTTLRPWRWGMRIGLRGDVGRRFTQGPDTNHALVRRLSPYGMIALQYGPLCKIGLSYKGFVIANDPALSGNKSYSLFSAGFDFRFPSGRGAKGKDPTLGPLGLSAKYQVGREDPLYQRQNSLTFGISLYNPE